MSRLRIILTPQPGASVGMTELEAWGRAALPLAPADAQPVNLAWGARPRASFTSRYDSVSEINDMVVAFSRYSRNRWTSYGSPNASDWIELDLPAAHGVARVELYLWGDGGGTRAPAGYTVQAWQHGAWVDVAIRSQVPATPMTSSVNTVSLTPVTTSRVRVVFRNARPAATGVTEVMLYGDD